MSCAGAAVRAPRLTGARSCCPSRADSVLHRQEEAVASCTPLQVVPMLHGPWLTLLASASTTGGFLGGFLGVWLGPPPTPTPQPQPHRCTLGGRWNRNRDKPICPHTAAEATPFTSCGWTSTLPHLWLRQRCHPAAPLQGHFQGEGAGICKTPVMMVYSCHF